MEAQSNPESNEEKKKARITFEDRNGIHQEFVDGPEGSAFDQLMEFRAAENNRDNK